MHNQTMAAKVSFSGAGNKTVLLRLAWCMEWNDRTTQRIRCRDVVSINLTDRYWPKILGVEGTCSLILWTCPMPQNLSTSKKFSELLQLPDHARLSVTENKQPLQFAPWASGSTWYLVFATVADSIRLSQGARKMARRNTTRPKLPQELLVTFGLCSLKFYCWKVVQGWTMLEDSGKLIKMAEGYGRMVETLNHFCDLLEDIVEVPIPWTHVWMDLPEGEQACHLGSWRSCQNVPRDEMMQCI